MKPRDFRYLKQSLSEMKKLNRSLTILGVLTVFLMVSLFTYQTRILRDYHVEDQEFQTVKFPDLVRDGRNDTNPLLSAAMRISKGGREALLVTLVNDAFLPFTFSWLCNTQGMGIHSQVLFITGDSESALKINQKWPEVTAIQIDGVHSGNQEYSHVGYVEMMVRRSEILLQILERNIPIFLFEVDCIWITNPLNSIQSYSNVDIVVSAVSTESNVVAGGFLYLHPTEFSKKLWRALTEQLKQLGLKIRNSAAGNLVSEGDNDQQYLSKLVFSKYGGLRYKILSTEDYADGKWYSLSKEERSKRKMPFIINNNWVVGNPAKIKRAKAWNHWFLTESGDCDLKNVKRVVEQHLL